jgi:hypothetical protein
MEWLSWWPSVPWQRMAFGLTICAAIVAVLMAVRRRKRGKALPPDKRV